MSERGHKIARISCGHEHKYTYTVDNTNVRYAPLIPRECDKCEYKMYPQALNYNITVEVERFVESP